MHRLTRYLKNIQFFPKENIGLFTSRLNTVKLQPGEFLPITVPFNSWIFIEEGLLVELRTTNKKKPITERIFFQGRSVKYTHHLFDHNPLGKAMLKAVEPTILYYIPPVHSDDVILKITYSAITNAMTKGSLAQDRLRRFLRSANTSKKISKIIKNYPSVLRIPAKNLYEYLKVKSVYQKKQLRNAQTLYRKSHPLPVCPENSSTNMLSTPAMVAFSSNNFN